ncbi:hypothetical protein K474DRAFT_1592591 [Panus rudis PR-1116 ss-1]|nr:hypothetical protein K474DRAFT_1592591 [Panus rudis PR-1116 ss-1]
MRILGKDTPNVLSLYTTLVLSAEKRAIEDKSERNLIFARVLGYALLYPLSSEAQTYLESKLAFLNRYSDDAVKLREAYQLGEVYLKDFISIFKNARGRTSCTSDDSPPTFYDNDKQTQEKMKDSHINPRDHLSTKEAALVRDDFRCMVTRRVDVESLEHHKTESRHRELGTDSQCCYIFPELLGNAAARGPNAKLWDILEAFGYGDICKELSAETAGSNIHRLENIMTLDPTICGLFDKQKLWFEDIRNEEHCYKVCLARHVPRLGIPETVRFENHANYAYPLPSPRYLQIHAHCCRIAHLSGGAQYLDSRLRDIEETHVLSTDGSSSDVLDYALNRVIV